MDAKTIQLRGEYERYEGVAGATILPGMLVGVQSDGTIDYHKDEGGFAEKAFAVENALAGKTITDAYSADDLIQYNIQRPGSIVQALVKDGEDVDIGDMLFSHGDGYLRPLDTSSLATNAFPVGVALTAVDMSGSDDPSGFVRLRIV
jgi:hypothetical protein